MTNRYSAYPHPIPGGRYWAMIRLCRDSHPAPVMDTGDRPKVFESKGAAAEECLRHVIAFMNGHPIRGERFDESATKRTVARSAAERLFERDGRAA